MRQIVSPALAGLCNDEQMSRPSEFHPIQAVEADVRPSARFQHQRDVTPLFDRPAPPLWRELFRGSCEESPDLDWKGADFVRCNPEVVERVEQRLRDITESTNAAFATHLAEANPGELSRLMDEGINFPPDGGTYGLDFPRPRY